MAGIPGKVVAVAAALLVGLAGAVWLSGLDEPSGRRAGPAQPGAAQEDYRYKSIVCMSPAASEIVFVAGAGGRVVGVSQWTQHPPEALGLPRCGGFYNPNYERILALEPDLIFTQGEAEDLRRFARGYGMEVCSLALTDLESITREVRRVGVLLQTEPQAELVSAEMQYRLARVRARVAREPVVGVLLVTGRQPDALNDIATVGPRTFLHDLVAAAGGRNVFDDLFMDYGVISKEALVARAPEVIVELHGEGGDHARLEREVRGLWNAMPSLPAVRDGRVYAVEATYALIPGPRVVDLAERLADLLHGEAEQ